MAALTKLIKELEKELKSKQKEKKKLQKPSKDQLKTQRAKIRSEIKNLQGEISRTAWEINDLSGQINLAWEAMREDDDYKNARSNWEKAKQEYDGVRTELNSVYQGREFREPTKLKQDIEQQIREAEYMVNFGSISRVQENEKNREIQKLRQDLEDVQNYINSNVSAQFKELKERRKGKNEQYEEYERLRKSRDVSRKTIDDMKSARDTKQDLRKELNAQLEKLIEQRNKLDPAFTEKMTKWNNLTKDISTLEGRIAFEKNQAQMAKQNKEENARRDIQKQREDEEKSNEQQEREERQREAERKQEERLAELEARRAAAIAAHRKAQARFTTASGPGQWGGPPPQCGWQDCMDNMGMPDQRCCSRCTRRLPKDQTALLRS